MACFRSARMRPSRAFSLLLLAFSPGCLTAIEMVRQHEVPQDRLASVDEAWLAPDGELRIAAKVWLSDDYIGQAVLRIPSDELDSALDEAPTSPQQAREHALPRSVLTRGELSADERTHSRLVPVPVYLPGRDLEDQLDLADLVPDPTAEWTVYDLTGRGDSRPAYQVSRPRLRIAVSRRTPGSPGARFALFDLQPEDLSAGEQVGRDSRRLLGALALDAIVLGMIALL